MPKHCDPCVFPRARDFDLAQHHNARHKHLGALSKRFPMLQLQKLLTHLIKVAQRYLRASWHSTIFGNFLVRKLIFFYKIEVLSTASIIKSWAPKYVLATKKSRECQRKSWRLFKFSRCWLKARLTDSSDEEMLW